MTPDHLDRPQNCRWLIDGLSLSGLAWGPENGTPVLALHGWMDHAASFRELAPRLTGCRVVGLDLSGQGLSDHRSAHATYNIWDDLPQIAELLDRLGWHRCVLVGHSRGANISALFAAAQPEKVRALVALEALAPEPTGAEDFVSTLRTFIEETSRHKAAPPRTFPTKADYIARRTARGNSRRTSEALADRALDEGPNSVRLRGDARLFASSAVKLTRDQVETVLRSIRAPVLNIWASRGIASVRPAVAELVGIAETAIGRYERLELAGDHHFHLDPEIAGQIARATVDFLARHREP